jgi:xylulokinase
MHTANFPKSQFFVSVTMPTTTILGLDIGTTATKAVLFDLSGHELATAEQPYPLLTPQPGWAEEDPEAVWQALVQAVRSILAQVGPEVGASIAALALSAQAGSLIPVKADGRPTYPIITWMDRRAEELVNNWRLEGVEPTVRRISGWSLQIGLPLPFIAWLRQYRPDVFAATDRFLGINDFLVQRLTGHFCTDYSCGTEMLLADVSTGQWSQELCDLAGITPARLPELRPSGVVIGPISAEASRQTGLPTSTLVVNGGHDHCCEALAMGITPGELMLTCGTAWVITGVMEQPDLATLPPSMDLNFHVAPQRWAPSRFLGGFGATVEWWLNGVWQNAEPQPPLSRADLYAVMNRALAQTQPGSNNLLFLPVHTAYGGFAGLRLDHSRADMSRAILEGCAFELRGALEDMRRANLPVERLWMAGGATRSPVWTRILADVTGVPLTLTEYAHWSALGAAILAGWGAGVFGSVEAGQSRLQKPVRPLEPDATQRPVYDERFATYQKLVDSRR